MIELKNITTIGMSLLLVGGLSLTSVTATAGPGRGPIHWDKVTVIEKPREYRPRRYDGRGRGVMAVPRTRYYRDVHIARHHGRPYLGYGFYVSDTDAYKWLAFTAISLKVLDNLNEDQQRLHESAQVKATVADVGETIIWDDAGASGSVTTVRKGQNKSGQQCREFRQTVSIGNKTEQAYGTACLKADGSWQIVQ